MFINFWKFLKAFSPEAGPTKSTQEIKTHTKLPFDQRDLSVLAYGVSSFKCKNDSYNTYLVISSVLNISIQNNLAVW